MRRNLVECMQTLLNAGEAMRIPLVRILNPFGVRKETA